jgi:hypothetical protein
VVLLTGRELAMRSDSLWIYGPMSQDTESQVKPKIGEEPGSELQGNQCKHESVGAWVRDHGVNHGVESWESSGNETTFLP